MLEADKNHMDEFLSVGIHLPENLVFQDYSSLIRSMRKRLRMTQTQLAKRTSFPQSYIAKIESRKITPSIETLNKIFQGFGCSLTLLLIPQQEPEEMIKKQAYKTAKKRIQSVAGTMAMEEQLPSESSLEKMIRMEQKKLIDSESTQIWD